MGNLKLLGLNAVRCKADNGEIIADMYSTIETEAHGTISVDSICNRHSGLLLSQNVDVRFWLSTDGKNLVPWIEQYKKVMGDRQWMDFVGDLHHGRIGLTLEKLYKMLYAAQAKADYKRMEQQAIEYERQYRHAQRQIEELEQRVEELQQQVRQKIAPPAQKYNLDINEIRNMRKSMSVDKIAQTLHCSKRTVYNALKKGNDC